jgi:hypothetical protein
MKEVWHVTILDAEGHPDSRLLDTEQLWNEGNEAERDLADAIFTASQSEGNTSSVSYETQQETLDSTAQVKEFPAEVRIMGWVTLYSSED